MKTLKRITLLIICSLSFNISYAQSPVNSVGSGCALSFSAGTKIEMSNTNLLGTSNDFTLSLWVNPANSQPLYADILDWSHASPNNTNFVLQQDANITNSFLVGFRSISEIWQMSPSIQLVANKWQHLCYVKNGTTSHYYLDGILIHSTTVAALIKKTTLKLIIAGNGVPTFSSRYFNGQVDEVRIWNRALSQTEIRNNMNKSLTGNEPGLVAYYPMNEGADGTCPGGKDVCDKSGNGNDGTKF